MDLRVLNKSFLKSLLIVGFFFVCKTNATQIFSYHCPLSCPHYETSSDTSIIVRSNYTLSSNHQTKFSDWVAYKIDPSNFGTSKPRNWKKEPWIDDESTLTPIEYKGAYFKLDADRGHMVPLASFSNTVEWEETNLLTNIIPQKKGFNRGVWSILEDKVRVYSISAKSGVYVLAGALKTNQFSDKMKLPNTKKEHTIPSYFWKVIYEIKDNNVEYAAFGFEMVEPYKYSANVCDYMISVEELELLADIKLFPRAKSVNQSSLISNSFNCVSN